MHEIRPFQVMALLARARELEAGGRSIIHMEIGEPDFVSPAPVIHAGQQALEEGRTHYTPARGLPELRLAISDFYRQRYGVEISPERVLVTPGASGALQLVMGALIDAGSEVLMSDPGYPCNRNFVRLVDAKPVGVPVDRESEYQLTTELLRAHWSGNTAAVMVASPSNPTGTLVSDRHMQELVAFTRERGAHLIVDEIYHCLVYEGNTNTVLAHTDEAYVINSFSKYFGMTGWRIGWLVVPESSIRDFDKLAQNVFLAASTPAQYAALSAFSTETLEILEQRRQAFRERRDFLLPALRNIGFGLPVTPQGAFYLYADCSRFTTDSHAFTTALLEEAGVAITPGMDFGEYAPQRHVRFAYTTSMENLREGVERIRAFVNRPA